MMIIPDITKDQKTNDLFDVHNYERHVQYLTENIIRFRSYEALYMTRFYEPWFKQHITFAQLFPNRYKKLTELMIDNKWIALRMLPEAETVELINTHLLALFTMLQRYPFSWDYSELPDFTLSEDMRVNILRLPDLDARDYYKAQLSVALTTNQESITTAPFFASIKQVRPTVALWFQEYLHALGPNASSSEFLLSQFLNKSDQGVKLKAADRHRLELIFKLYHRLARSSWTIEGIEEKFPFESKDQIGVIQYGEVTPYDQTTMAQIKKLEELYPVAPTGVAIRPPVERVGVKRITTDIATGPNIDATKGPDYFTDQDQAEVQKHSVEIDQSAPAAHAKTDPVKQAGDLKKLLALTFTTPDQDKRFTDIVVSVLRGLRDIMEFREYLVELGYPAHQIITIVGAVRDLLPDHQARQRITKKSIPPTATTPTVAQVQTKTPLAATTAPVSTMSTPTPAMTTIEPARHTSQPAKTFFPKLRRSRVTKKPLIDDVKLQPSMVMGPIDELRAMDALEFRRLSPNPNQAAATLKDKIDLLAEESVSKQAEGIQAFKQSPLNTMYIELGNQSISTGQPVTDLIASWEARGTPTLSVEEFNAVADLNTKLRF